MTNTSRKKRANRKKTSVSADLSVTNSRVMTNTLWRMATLSCFVIPGRTWRV